MVKWTIPEEEDENSKYLGVTISNELSEYRRQGYFSIQCLRGRERMVVGFVTTYAISVYPH
jgi:hypothetical protein